ncbi:MAG: hypothetical protein HRU07_09525 [Nitrosopumilus sp.]|nr:hypothetical protein [Nitrosopumilus sp.]NRA06366.1 hypothetical protein [Nitrosopumilus sp.]
MDFSKSKTGPLKWLAVYNTGNSYLLNDEDINSQSFQIDLIKIISLKTLQGFSPEEFFKKKGI